jgi:glycosyltransferase involved in cell wall biosynthesis
MTNVSICTPTFNRRPFIKFMIKNIERQTYPKELIEWIIIDDGTDKIEDLVKDISYVHYTSLDKKIKLGEKRNMMHEKCRFKGDDDVIVYIDDDDYYPPERISHSVEKLNNNPDALCSGASELFLWFNELNKMFKFGPYHDNHATAGTFAFKRRLLKNSHYENSAALAEEKFFLNNYTVPFVQLDAMKTILVIAHNQNTFDKKELIRPDNQFCKESDLKIEDFIKDTDTLEFYKNINTFLDVYSDGKVENKPDVLEQIAEIRKRNTVKEKDIVYTKDDGTKVSLNKSQIIDLYQNKSNEVDNLKEQLDSINSDKIEYNGYTINPSQIMRTLSIIEDRLNKCNLEPLQEVNDKLRKENDKMRSILNVIMNKDLVKENAELKNRIMEYEEGRATMSKENMKLKDKLNEILNNCSNI